MRRAFGFLTVLGGAAPPNASAVYWFPVVGALVGAAVGGVWWGADRLWAPGVAAALAVVADVVLTGALHYDGLVDAADGLLPPLERERRLEVMADPRAGAFGVVTCVVVVLLRWSAFSAMRPSVWLVAAVWAASRTTMAVALCTLKYARTEGLASPFRLGGSSAGGAAAAGLVAVGVAVGASGNFGRVTAAVVVTLAAAGAVHLFARRRLGGYTGDVLGAAGVIAETVGLVVAASVKW